LHTGHNQSCQNLTCMIVLCCISWPCSYCVMPSMVWSSAPCRRPPLQCLPQEQDMISPALHLVGGLKAFGFNLFCISVGYLIARLLLKFIFDKLRSIHCKKKKEIDSVVAGRFLLSSYRQSYVVCYVCMDFFPVRRWSSPRVGIERRRLVLYDRWTGRPYSSRSLTDVPLHCLQIGFTCPCSFSFFYSVKVHLVYVSYGGKRACLEVHLEDCKRDSLKSSLYRSHKRLQTCQPWFTVNLGH
jgi:hypothetical protein